MKALCVPRESTCGTAELVTNASIFLRIASALHQHTTGRIITQGGKPETDYGPGKTVGDDFMSAMMSCDRSARLPSPCRHRGDPTGRVPPGTVDSEGSHVGSRDQRRQDAPLADGEDV